MLDIKLKNGIRVVGEHLPGFRSVSIGLWAAAGSVTETEATNGYSHFIEHMLFKGTNKRSARDIAMQMDGIGAQLNAFTAKECTCYYAKLTSEHLAEGVDVLCDMFCDPAFDNEEIKKEKGVVCEEIDMFLDTPDDVCLETTSQIFFEGTPLKRTILGPRENIRSLTRSGISDYKNKHYTAENVVVSVAGAFDDNEIIDLLEEKLTGIASGSGRPDFDYTAFTPPKRFEIVDREIEQVHIGFALPGVAFEQSDRYALSIVCNLLGGSMSSRLFQKIREEMGAAYSVYSYTSAYSGAGMTGMYAATGKDSAAAVAEEMVKQLEILRTDGMSKEDLVQGKEQLRGNYVLSQESASARMNALGKNVLLYGRALSEEELISSLMAVTPEQIDSVIKKYIDPQKMSGAIVGRPTDVKRIEALFA